jgi:hypothetical protein
MRAEVNRVLALGATRQTVEPIQENGWTWHILEDPDGNEFCVLQAPPDYWGPDRGKLTGHRRLGVGGGGLGIAGEHAQRVRREVGVHRGAL